MQGVRGRRAGMRILPAGWIFILIAILLIFAALNTGINLLFIVLGGVISFIMLSSVLAVWSLRGLTMRRESPHAVQRGEPFLVEVRIGNGKWITPSLSLRVESAEARGTMIGYAMQAPARRTVTLSVTQTLSRRGVHTLHPFDLATSFPFGLIEHRRRFADSTEVVVYPKVRAVRVNLLDRLPGAAASPRTADPNGDEFFALREYLPGDDLRRIVWRISARLGVWMVRELTQHHSRDVVFLLDACAIPGMPEFEERFEDAVEWTASLAITLLKRQHNVGVVSQEYAVKLGEGTGQERRVLEMLARVQPISATACENLETLARRHDAGAARMVCISPNPDLWGRIGATQRTAYLDPREIVHV